MLAKLRGETSNFRGRGRGWFGDCMNFFEPFLELGFVFLGHGFGWYFSFVQHAFYRLTKRELSFVGRGRAHSFFVTLSRACLQYARPPPAKDPIVCSTLHWPAQQGGTEEALQRHLEAIQSLSATKTAWRKPSVPAVTLNTAGLPFQHTRAPGVTPPTSCLPLQTGLPVTHWPYQPRARLHSRWKREKREEERGKNRKRQERGGSPLHSG